MFKDRIELGKDQGEIYTLAVTPQQPEKIPATVQGFCRGRVRDLGKKEGDLPWVCTHIRTDCYANFFENGLEIVDTYGVIKKKMDGGGVRSIVKEFSKASRARAVAFLMHFGRPGSQLHAYHLTLPGGYDSDLWKKLLDRLRHDAIRQGVSFFWRIELQRRRVPHLHVLAWIENSTKGWRVFTEGWFESLPEERRNMKGAKEHCVQGNQINDNGVEAFAYEVAHATKKKKSQLGWKGRQWGVVGRKWMVRRKPEEAFKLNMRQSIYVRRTIRRWIEKKGKKSCGYFMKAKTLRRFVSPEVLRPLVVWTLKNYPSKAS